ncbi:hypothetical protein SUGI_1144000 [Cryptomeria japonica]|uniref:uncharacterized protein LOC131040128 n=1 Tax=Cryptomeria japonica TaxID=3369 RepID=UPI0024149F31|nr:uncharacterized protein LOC131040128 [Cryptomeria japonica]GLJ53632.1 hypothetical protein SUGI_1144000 [Cryptomeria japonica]
MMGSPLFLALGVIVLLFGWDAAAQTSNSSCPLKFTGETKTFQYCSKLNALGATLSYIYHVENGSLEIAFQAKPPASGGWVCWGINPKGLAMIGTQALIAFRLGNGTTVVDTYDVESKSDALNRSKISLNVTSKSAVYEASSGKITIFASLVLDSNQISINQVWQVGSSVTNFSPDVHKFDDANLQSLGALNLSEATSVPSSPITPTSNSGCPIKFTGVAKTYDTCNNMSLGSTLSYIYHEQNGSFDIAFQAKPSASGGWVGWGINPQGLQMIGTQTLIAFRLANGTTLVDTYDVVSKSDALNPSKISLNVTNKSAMYESSSGKITIFASLVLNSSQTSVNQVWQVGSSVSNLSPGVHSFVQTNLKSLGTLNLQSGATSAPPVESPTPAVNTTPSTQTSNANCPLQFTEGGSKSYKFCSNLNLGATVSYIYHQQNGSLDIAFKAAPLASGGWVGWGINPQGSQMIGTQALIAFRLSNGSTVVGTYDVQSKSTVTPSPISLTVTSKSAVYESSSGKITIFASLVLSSTQTSVNQVWQVGSTVSNSVPGIHSLTPANLRTAGTLDLLSGATSASGSSAHQTLKNRHGILTVVSWGILMPIGVMIARYVKTFEVADPAWFYLHAICQTSGYAIGVGGWATGLKLGSYSKGIEQTSHRRIGIILFALATLQVFALLLRPKKDNKFRIYWNIYHHSVGYSVIVLSIINIFKGFDILDPEKKWKRAYIGVLIALGAIAALLEIVTWIIYFQRKSRNSSKHRSEMNGNGR